MKYLLFLSLALNLALFWQLRQKPKVVRAPTRVQWKTSAPAQAQEVRDEVKTVAASSAEPARPPVMSAPFTEADYQHMAEKVQEDRLNQLLELGISEEKIEAAKPLMQKYNDRIAKIYMEQNGLVTREQRRQVIEIEEELADALAKHYGPEKFKKFEEYRKKYNDQILEAMQNLEENQPFVLMEL